MDNQKPLLFLDTETTGLSEPRLVSLAYSHETSDFVSYALFKPAKPIEFGASAINHISNRMVENLKPFEGSADKKLLQSLLDTHTLVAHNARFDVGVLQNEGVIATDVLCTKQHAQNILGNKDNSPNSYSLQYLRYFLDLDIPSALAHTAAGDVAVMKALYVKLQEMA